MIIDLSSRRVATNDDAGFEFDCGICGDRIWVAIRYDHFPSCSMCRAFCCMAYVSARKLYKGTIR